MTMIAIYARQSVEKKDSISIESQIEYGKREAFNAPYQVYQDAGYSGKNTNRPAFMQMMQDIQDGKIEKVVVYRLDRISRSIVDFADFIQTLEEHQVSFVSATEKFDTSAPMGRAMLYIIVVFAQLERETIAERVRDNYYARIKNGAWGGGPAAYGYDLCRTIIHGKKATIYQPNANLSVVGRIFRLYTQPGASLASVQRALIADGIKTSGGVNFDNVKLASILKNPAYVRADLAICQYYQDKGVILANDPEEFDGIHGCILVGKRNASDRKYKSVENHLLALGHHEGIVDSSTFLYCQQKLSENKQIKNTGKGKYTWLTGLVHCGHCGYSFSVRCSHTKYGQTPYFYCSGKYLHHSCNVEQTHRVWDVEEQVEQVLFAEVGKYNLRQEARKNAAQQEIQQQIQDIDARIEHLVSTLETMGATSAEYVNKRIDKLHAEKAQLQHQFQKNLAAAHIPVIAPFTKSDWHGMVMEEKHRIAQLMIEDVILTDSGVSVKLK